MPMGGVAVGPVPVKVSDCYILNVIYTFWTNPNYLCSGYWLAPLLKISKSDDSLLQTLLQIKTIIEYSSDWCLIQTTL